MYIQRFNNNKIWHNYFLHYQNIGVNGLHFTQIQTSEPIKIPVLPFLRKECWRCNLVILHLIKSYLLLYKYLILLQLKVFIRDLLETFHLQQIWKTKQHTQIASYLMYFLYWKHYISITLEDLYSTFLYQYFLHNVNFFSMVLFYRFQKYR